MRIECTDSEIVVEAQGVFSSRKPFKMAWKSVSQQENVKAS